MRCLFLEGESSEGIKGSALGLVSTHPHTQLQTKQGPRTTVYSSNYSPEHMRGAWSRTQRQPGGVLQRQGEQKAKAHQSLKAHLILALLDPQLQLPKAGGDTQTS